MALGIDFVQVGWEFLLPGKCDIVHLGSLAFWFLLEFLPV
jgi:hypothetical protein